MLERILKNLGALATSHGILLFTQLLIPPVFIASYGVKSYGEWLVLSAAIAYVTVLDFGLQTYVINELTGFYHRGEMERFHRLQSTALRMEVGVFILFSLLALSLFLLPLSSMLNLGLPSLEASLTAYLLVLQLLWGIALGYMNGVFRAFGKAHRGAMWANVQKLLLLLTTIVLVLNKEPFWVIALGQLLTLLPSVVITLFDFKRSAPDAFPTLRVWDGALAGSIIKPSAFFGLFIFNNYLLYQAPVLILNYFLGSATVVVFTIARTLFSFVRQASATIQAALAPEITRLGGLRDQLRLRRLYTLSESLVLTVSLVLNTVVLVLAPLLLLIWVKKPELFNPDIYILMTVIAVLMSVKEYKLYFQYATNNHYSTAAITSITYLAMFAGSIPIVQAFGLAGLMIEWLCVELVQVIFIHSFNKTLLQEAGGVSFIPVFKLAALLAGVLAFNRFILWDLVGANYKLEVISAVVVAVALSGVSYFVFGLNKVRQELKVFWLRRQMET